MLRFLLPTDRIEYLQLAFPVAGYQLVARWGTQTGPFTVAAWDDFANPPVWKLTDGPALQLSPDGEWVSVYDSSHGTVTVTRVGASQPHAVYRREPASNVWTAVSPGGDLVAWKENDGFTVVRTIVGGEPIARLRTGWAVDFRFSPGGRWLTEQGQKVLRVFDRSKNYRVVARVPMTRHGLAEFSDGMTAAVTTALDTVAVWEVPNKSPSAVLAVGGRVSALAVSADGRRVLTGTTAGDIVLWDAGGARLREYSWGVTTPIAAAFDAEGMRAAVGGTDRQVVVWDLDG